MASTRTVTQLMAEVRELANIEGMDAKWTDDKLERRINLSFSMFRELISDHGHPYYIREQEQTCSVPSSATDMTTEDLTLPTDCVRVMYIDLLDGGRYHPLEPYEASQRMSFDRSKLGKPYGYRIAKQDSAPNEGDIERSVRLYPRPDSTYTMRVTYLPHHTTLQSGHAVDGVQGWERWIICDVVAWVLSAESDTEQKVLVNQERALILEMIKEKRSKRQRQAPQRVTGSRRGKLWRHR